MSKRVRAALPAVLLSAGTFFSALTAVAPPAAFAAPPWPSYESSVCGAPAAGSATCRAVQLLSPSQHWAPGPWAHRAQGTSAGGGPGHPSAITPPGSGYYPVDFQSAYGLSGAASAMSTGAGAPTVAIVDAYDDPYAAADLSAYRASMSGAKDPNTGLTDPAMPPLCGSGVTTGCVTFTKVNEFGGTSYPRANTGWSEEISLDLDTVSGVCPDCNIVLVEASTSSLSDLATAVSEARKFNPVVVSNSYGGGESSSETSLNSTYSATSGTAITAAAGDSGYGTEFPASAPDLTAVGGTSLSYTGTGSGLSWQAQSIWDLSGSGCSSVETMPAWQADANVYSTASACSGRQVADISADADPQTGYAAYDTYGQGGWLVFGGTSLSTQIIAGAYAVASTTGHLATSPQALYVDYGTSATGPTPGLAPVAAGSNGSCGTYLCGATGTLSSGYNGPGGLGTPTGVSAFVNGGSSSSGALGFNPPSATVAAGTAGGPWSVTLSAAAPPTGLSVQLTTTSPGGAFSTSATGTYSATLALPIAPGAQAGQFFYKDSNAGTPTITASATGWTGAQLPVTVTSSGTQPGIAVKVATGSLSVRRGVYSIPITVTATSSSSGTGIGGASAALSIYQGSACSGTVAASGTFTTGSNGQTSVTFQTRTASTWCALASVTATGYTPGSGQHTFST